MKTVPLDSSDLHSCFATSRLLADKRVDWPATSPSGIVHGQRDGGWADVDRDKPVSVSAAFEIWYH